MDNLLKELNRPKYEVIIISDSNTEFIKYKMEAAGYHKIIHTTYTNPAVFDEQGILKVSSYHDQDWCTRSTVNLCKGYVLDEHIKQALNERNVIFTHVVYVGDGANDLCPAMHLRECDITFPRKGYPLMKDIENLSHDEKLQCRVVPWETGQDIIKELAELDANHKRGRSKLICCFS